MVISLSSWFYLLSSYSLKKAAYNDECTYVAQAYHFSEKSSLVTDFYIYESLLKQKPPLLPARHIAYVVLLGTVYKIFGFHEGLYLYLNFLLFSIFLFCFYQFGVKKINLKRECWLAVLLLISFPLINLLMRLLMADILIIFLFFLLIWLMFFYDPPKNLKKWYPLMVVLLFWICYLSRQTAVFILPVFFVYIFKIKGFKKVLIYLGLFLASFFLIYWFIERFKTVYFYVPYGCALTFIQEGSWSKAVGVLSKNFLNNLKLFFTEWPTIYYSYAKVSFWVIVGLAASSYRFLLDSGKKLYKIVFIIFVIQYTSLLVLFNAADWTGIRMMAYLIPFMFLLLVQGFLNVSTSRKVLSFVKGVIIFFVVCFFMMSFVVARNNYKYLKSLDHRQVGAKIILDKFIPKDKEVVVLSKIFDYRRMSIDFPNAIPIYMVQQVFTTPEDLEKISRNFRYPDLMLLSYVNNVIVIFDGKAKIFDLKEFLNPKK